MCGGKKSSSTSSQSVTNQDNRVAVQDGLVAQGGSTINVTTSDPQVLIETARVLGEANENVVQAASSFLADAGDQQTEQLGAVLDFATDAQGSAFSLAEKSQGDALQFVQDFERNRASEQQSEKDRNADRLTQFATVAVIALAASQILKAA